MVLNLKFLTHYQTSDRKCRTTRPSALTRRFILTGETLPHLPASGRVSIPACRADSTDGPALQARQGIFSWRAIHLLFTSLRYLPA